MSPAARLGMKFVELARILRNIDWPFSFGAHDMHARFGFSFAALFLLFPALPAFACDDGQVKFQENFTRPDKGWGDSSEIVQFAPGRVVLKPSPNAPSWVWNTDHVYEAAEICVDAELTRGDWTAETCAALQFWVVDNSNFYVFGVCGNGTAQVWRYLKDKWQPQVFNKQVKGLDPEHAGTISLSVIHIGTKAILYVNGDQVGQIQGRPPKGGTKAGVFAQTTAPNSPANVEFTFFKVMDAPDE
jgi:hypothetical protein